ncbi:MAG: hypothetical protein EHM49_00765 [Deltaproteobacteria bacterium]|nr:MAG: hypothetical protein EHM49_00765 [Deltaproteobacteria bacterium]
MGNGGTGKFFLRRIEAMKKIGKVQIIKEVDCYTDTSSWLGEYTDKFEEGVIVRKAKEFYEKLPEDYDFPEKGVYYRCFKPVAGDEKVGTKEYYEYGMQDYERAEGLEKGDWCFMGIHARAEVLTSDDGGNWLRNRLSSRGLWGIESDSDKEYFKEVEKEELAILKKVLITFGFTIREIEKAYKSIEEVEK